MSVGWRGVVAAVCLVATAGCGGGGGGGDDDDPLAGGPTTTRPTTDDGTARTIVLQQADMPAGWRGTAHAEDPGERDRARRLSNCIGRPDPETYRSAIVYGPDLTMGQAQVSTSATVLRTVDDARADLAAVRGPRFNGCLASAFTDVLAGQVQAGGKLQDVAAEPLAVADFGDGSVAVRLSANLVLPDRTDRLFADLVYVSKDRATVSATFFSFGQPFPGTLEESLVSRMGHRVAAA
jgi:hypothetical protein